KRKHQVMVSSMILLAWFGAGHSPFYRLSAARPTVSGTCRRTGTSFSVFALPGLTTEHLYKFTALDWYPAQKTSTPPMEYRQSRTRSFGATSSPAQNRRGGSETEQSGRSVRMNPVDRTDYLPKVRCRYSRICACVSAADHTSSAD